MPSPARDIMDSRTRKRRESLVAANISIVKAADLPLEDLGSDQYVIDGRFIFCGVTGLWRDCKDNARKGYGARSLVAAARTNEAP